MKIIDLNDLSISCIHSIECEDLRNYDVFIKFSNFAHGKELKYKLNLICSHYLNYYVFVDRQVNIPILFLLDEMEMIDKLDSLSDYLKLTKNDLIICMFWKSFRQGQHVYGEKMFEDILQLCTTIAFLGSHDMKDINKLSQHNISGKELMLLEPDKLWLFQLGVGWEKINKFKV